MPPKKDDKGKVPEAPESGEQVRVLLTEANNALNYAGHCVWEER